MPAVSLGSSITVVLVASGFLSFGLICGCCFVFSVGEIGEAFAWIRETGEEWIG